MNGNNRSLQAEHRTRPVATRTTPAPHTRTTRTTHVLPVDADLGPIGNAITARIAATKKRLLDGGVMRPIEWGIPGEPDIRGRKVFTYFMLDALIEQRPALDRGSGFTTDRSDDTVLIILDPLAITDGHLFRWGEPAHAYSVKAVDGIVQDAESGIRYASEVTVVR